MRQQTHLPPLRQLESRDQQLWLFAVFMTLACLGALVAVVVPQAVLSRLPDWMLAADLERYLNAFSLLVLLFCFYVLYTQRQIRTLRARLWEGDVERETLDRTVKLTHSLVESSAVLISESDLEPALAGVVEAACQALGARQAALHLDLAQSGQLHRSVVAGDASAHSAEEAKAVQAALDNRRMLTLRQGSQHGLAVPLLHRGDCFGALVVWVDSPLGTLGERLVSVFANNAAAAINIARLRTRQEQLRYPLDMTNTDC